MTQRRQELAKTLPQARPCRPSRHVPATLAAPKPRGLLKAVGAVVLVLLVGGAGAAWWLMRPTLSPAERIAAAEALATGKERRSALKGLEGDERATAPELARAGALLIDAGEHDAALDLAETFIRRFPKEVGCAPAGREGGHRAPEGQAGRASH